MRVLLLGGTGYLGGNIVHKLVEDGYNLTCVVRNTSDTSRIEQLDVEFISSELTEIEIYLKHTSVDWVVNSVCTYKANNTLYGDLLSSNLIFPLSVLNLAVKYCIKNYITIGTSLPEQLNLYSFAKDKFGQFGEYLSRTDSINFADLQLEMFYGGLFEPDNRFLSSCKKKMRNNDIIDLTIGTQKRDIVRVEDVVGLISKLMASDYLEGYKSLPVGSGEQHTVRDILSYLKNKISSKSELNYGAIPFRSAEPDTLADISWYKDIGFEPRFGFYEGLDLYSRE